ncbi:MAG: branched-chain amino acid aminotransferase [Bdellovibrionaceae bacterium]|nr:branched-chain amino acid aminotransferase [Pseudobdellovibrionaceae bacterium]NUM60270.1 branched-chain amino acid aminotransferase [Pseudobdellovibrionaceae bacterium]
MHQDFSLKNISIEKNNHPLPKPGADVNLGFGKYFTDHIFTAHFKRNQGGWQNFQIKPYSHLSMDPAACVYHYGQALFEGLKAFRQHDGKVAIFRPEFNANRMNQGCDRLDMSPVPKELFVNAVKELVSLERDWIPTGMGTALYIRPTLVGTEGFLGVRPSDEYLFFILLSPVGSYYTSGSKSVRIWVETEEIRAAKGGLGAIKAAANYASSLHAAAKQKKNGFDQVLWLDAMTKDQIEEVGTMNVFFVLKNEIVTPALNGSILPGGIRECTIKLLKDMNLPINERPVTMTELVAAYKKGEFLEMFGTGTAAVISPVGELQYKDLTMKLNENPDSIANKLYKEFTDIQYGYKEDRYQWLTHI